VKEARHKKIPHIVRFHFYEIPTPSTSVETESKARERERWRVAENGYGVSLGDEMFWNLIAVIAAHICEYTKNDRILLLLFFLSVPGFELGTSHLLCHLSYAPTLQNFLHF
jgi:hypothetical protein